MRFNISNSEILDEYPNIFVQQSNIQGQSKFPGFVNYLLIHAKLVTFIKYLLYILFSKTAK